MAEEPKPPVELTFKRGPAEEADTRIERMRLGHTEQLELFRAAISAGQSAMKAGFLVNGAAAVALLAFIGNATSSGVAKGFVGPLALPLLLYVLGAFLGVVSQGFVYLAQVGYKEGDKERGDRWNRVTVGLGILGLLTFPLASWFAYRFFASL